MLDVDRSRKYLRFMPKVRPLARLADVLLPDGLGAFITAQRDEGKSWDSIAKALYVATNHEIDVTGVTVQTWAADIEANTPDAA